jgi:hypothetical protein
LNIGCDRVYGKTKKIEVGLGCEGLVAWVKDKLKAWDMMDYRDNEICFQPSLEICLCSSAIDLILSSCHNFI